MFKGLMPREERFFDLFRDSAVLIVKGAHAFRQMLEQPENFEVRAREIKEIEHKADDVTHRTVELLHKTFITPLDREDIHELISRMDDILDRIEGASLRMHMYDVKIATPEMRALADVCIQSAECIQRAVNSLHDLSFVSGIIQDCVEVNRLENEADHILRSSIARLFKEEQDPKQIIKLKEIYELLESVTDRCEDVANIIEGIVLEYA